jgi:DNA-binding NarL/FixJ family response regulator
MIVDSTESLAAACESSIEVITIVIADDHPVVREGLAAIFKCQKDIKLVGEATDGEEAVELCGRHLPDVLLLDLRMPRMDGLQVISKLTALRIGKPRVIVMTTYETEEDVRRAMNAGAKGYLVKGTAPEQIREAVRRVVSAEALVSPNIAAKLAQSMARPELSKRENEVLLYLADGRINKEISKILSISENTVKKHVTSILTKLDATGRTEAIHVAIKRGLIKPAH